jgi:SH3-like domain-containing protein
MQKKTGVKSVKSKKMLRWLFCFVLVWTIPLEATQKQRSCNQMACLRHSKVNVHVGPGLQYPVDWVLQYKDMPLVIVREFGQWRRVKLFDGTSGWIHKSLLSSKKTFIMKNEAYLFSTPTELSLKIAKISPNVVVLFVKEKGQWFKVFINTKDGDKLVGWIKASNVWIPEE